LLPRTHTHELLTSQRKVIDKVILTPTAEDNVKKKVEILLSKNKFRFEVIKSKLGDPPIY
jgi:hypothetical protein